MGKINQSVAAGQRVSHSTTLHGWGAGVLACVCINALILFPSTVSALGFAISGRHTYTHRCKLASPAASGLEPVRDQVATGEAVAVVRDLRKR